MAVTESCVVCPRSITVVTPSAYRGSSIALNDHVFFQNNYVFVLSTLFEIDDFDWMSSVGGSGNADVW